MRVYVVGQMLGARCMFQNLIGIKEPMITSANVNLHYEPSTLLSPLYRRGSEVLNNLPMIIQLERNWGTSPVVQWLIKTLPSNAGDVGSIPGQGTNVPHAWRAGKIKKKKKERKELSRAPRSVQDICLYAIFPLQSQGSKQTTQNLQWTCREERDRELTSVQSEVWIAEVIQREWKGKEGPVRIQMERKYDVKVNWEEWRQQRVP